MNTFQTQLYGRMNRSSVITSYSIHYTKLYESVIRSSAPQESITPIISRIFWLASSPTLIPLPERSRIFWMEATSGRDSINGCKQTSSNWITIECARSGFESELRSLWNWWGRFFPKTKHRITSYNVCYTKLLRLVMLRQPISSIPQPLDPLARL